MMRKRTLLLTILCFFICVGQGGAVSARSYNYAPNGLATVTGTVESTGLNSIDIYDEYQKRSRRFVYFEHGEGFHQGDYVRVYYHPKGGVVGMIKRMTVLEYKKNGQNLGYIWR